MQAITDWPKNLRVEVRGDDVAQHAGCVLPRMLADATGLTEALSAAVSRPEVTHDRGAVPRDVAVSICDGGRDICDVVVLGQQPRLLGPVASIPTVWRSLNELDAPDVAAITVVRNRIRPKVWEAIAARHGAIPPAPTCYGDLGATIVIRIDASLVDSRSDKQHAAGNFKGGWGFHPLTLRHRLLHTAVRLISHSRHLILRVCQTWPWAHEFADAFNRALAIP